MLKHILSHFQLLSNLHIFTEDNATFAKGSSILSCSPVSQDQSHLHSKGGTDVLWVKLKRPYLRY